LLQIPVTRSSSIAQEAGMSRGRWCSVVWTSPSDPPAWAGRWVPESGRPLPGLSVITSSAAGGLCRVVLAGELNLMTVPLLRGALDETGPAMPRSAGVLLDLVRVTFLDVAGVTSLRLTDRLVRQRGHDLAVAPPAAPGPGRMLLLAVGTGLLRPVFGGTEENGRGR
jgi:hypothetical protein